MTLVLLWMLAVGSGCVFSGSDGDEGQSPDLPSDEELTGLLIETYRADAYFGTVDDSDAVVAITVREGGFTDVYVCGGDETFASHSRWFCPDDLIDEGVEVSFDRDGWVMHAERKTDRVVGSLLAPSEENGAWGAGREYTFEALAVDDTLRMGTFQRRDGPNNCSGAIVWQQGDEPVQMVGTYCFDDGDVQQVTPILQFKPSPDSAIIKVLAGEGETATEVFLLNNELF